MDHPGEAGERELRRQPGHPLGVVFDHLQLPADLAEFCVAGDQQVAEAEDLLVATGDLLPGVQLVRLGDRGPRPAG